MSSAPGNIFLTTENLAFSLPLIVVCGSYAFFKFVPLYIGLPLVGGLVLLYQIRAGLTALKSKKLTNMDEQAINDLALELKGEDDTAEADDAAAKKMGKKKAAIQKRLEVEAKTASKKKEKKQADDDDDDIALDAFAKNGGKKKN